MARMTPQSTVPDDEPQASNPASVPLQKGRWFRHYPFWPLFWALLALIDLVIALQFEKEDLGSKVFGTAFTLLLLANWVCWIRPKYLFEHGDALPGLVVATAPLRVAVLTDMTKGFGSYPALKVVRVPLARIMGRKPEPGMPLAMVSLYRGSTKDNLPYWKDFDPVAIETGTADPRMIQEVMATFPAEAWDELRHAVAKLPSYEPRLLRMHPPVPVR